MRHLSPADSCLGQASAVDPLTGVCCWVLPSLRLQSDSESSQPWAAGVTQSCGVFPGSDLARPQVVSTPWTLDGALLQLWRTVDM